MNLKIVGESLVEFHLRARKNGYWADVYDFADKAKPDKIRDFALYLSQALSS